MAPAKKPVANHHAKAEPMPAQSAGAAGEPRAQASERPSSFQPVFTRLVGDNPVAAIRSGLPVSAVDDVVRSGAITNVEIHHLILPRRTLSNRRAAGHLTADQSDKLVRVARLIAKAEEIFGAPEKAHRWLRRPTAPLNGEAPLNMLDTEAGARAVEELLIKIDHGIAA
jgi:putative toxin-antitoxin system antitoxin component (TIGR02293 family)